MDDWTLGMIVLVIKLIVFLAGLLLLATYLVWVERKFLARLQVRYGPNRAGRFGLLQPIADVIKLVAKEDTVPEGADRIIFLVAPAVSAATALLIFAVIPLGGGSHLLGGPLPPVITEIPIGLLYIFALSSLSVYGVAVGGWSSNSKYSLLGSIRSVAQMISYELAFVLSLVPIVMMARSFSLVDIV